MERLQALLDELHLIGISTRPIDEIMRDLRFINFIQYTVYIANNDEFEIGYNPETEKIVFRTTFANQTIDEAFIDKVLEVRDKSTMIVDVIKDLIQEIAV